MDPEQSNMVLSESKPGWPGGGYGQEQLAYHRRKNIFSLNENGVMAEGWYAVQGNWYYFYPGQGHKAVNTSISGFVLGL